MVAQLWFLLIDGTAFCAKRVGHNYLGFYQDRMKSLAKMRIELPDTYKSYKTFMSENVFGEGEEEVVHVNDEEQREFMKKFGADIEDEKARQKGKYRAESADTQNSSHGSQEEG